MSEVPLYNTWRDEQRDTRCTSKVDTRCTSKVDTRCTSKVHVLSPLAWNPNSDVTLVNQKLTHQENVHFL